MMSLFKMNIGDLKERKRKTTLEVHNGERGGKCSNLKRDFLGDRLGDVKQRAKQG